MTQVDDGNLATLFNMSSVARSSIIGRGGRLRGSGEGDGVPADGEGEAEEEEDGGEHVHLLGRRGVCTCEQPREHWSL